MENKFIHLRGAFASGKSTCARSVIKSGNFVVKEIFVGKKKLYFTHDEQRNIVVTGRYDTRECGGVDGEIKNKDLILEYVAAIMKKIRPSCIVFEAVMYGITVKFAQNMRILCERFGYEYVGLCFIPPLEQSLQWIYQRNNGKKIKEEHLIKMYDRNIVSFEKLKKMGST